VIAARCRDCGRPAVADCCEDPRPLCIASPDGVEIVCPVCFATVECCTEPGCDGAVVAVVVEDDLP
jgi:hypothetical protein